MDASKLILYGLIIILGGIGAYLPVWFFAQSPLGGWSILGSVVGGIAGIWVWAKLKDSIG